MTKFQNKYRIESVRRPGWDYSSEGYYYVTICTKNRENFFGIIKNGDMHISEIGEIANKYWMEIPEHFPFIQLDKYVIMPNHVHGILMIKKIHDLDCGRDRGHERGHIETLQCNVSANPPNNDINPPNNATDPLTTGNHRAMIKNPNPIMSAISPKRGSLGSVIRSYKSACTTTIDERFANSGFGWQSRFHDHIIRDERALNAIRNYIINNPKNWKDDENKN